MTNRPETPLARQAENMGEDVMSLEEIAAAFDRKRRVQRVVELHGILNGIRSRLRANER